MPSARILIIGAGGDTGRGLVRRLLADTALPDREITVTTRGLHPENPRRIPWPGAVRVLTLDPVGNPDAFRSVLQREPPFDCVYNLLGAWLRNATDVIEHGLLAILDSLRNTPDVAPRFVFCSGTTVYGDQPGVILDETSPTLSDMHVSRVFLRAENILKAAAREGRVDPIILRIPHVYGPGRERAFDLIRQGKMLIFGDGRNPMHHLHIDDFLQALVQAGNPAVAGGGIINVVDDDPAPYRAYCDAITDAGGIPPLSVCLQTDPFAADRAAEVLGPHFRDPVILREFFTFMTASMVIRNDAMRNRLKVKLQYPSFRDGLKTMLANETS